MDVNFTKGVYEYNLRDYGKRNNYRKAPYSVNHSIWSRPKKPNGLTKIINEIMHTLKEAGIEIEYDKKSNVRIIKLRKVSSPSSPSSPSSQNQEQAQKNGDNHRKNGGNDGIDDSLHTNKGEDENKPLLCMYKKSQEEV